MWFHKDVALGWREARNISWTGRHAGDTPAQGVSYWLYITTKILLYSSQKGNSLKYVLFHKILLQEALWEGDKGICAYIYQCYEYLAKYIFVKSAFVICIQIVWLLNEYALQVYFRWT